MKFNVVMAAIFAASLFGNTSYSLAAGDNDDAPSTTPTCKRGYVYSQKKKKCVRKRSEAIPDADLKSQGWTLAYAGKYAAAIELFEMVGAKNDPSVLNGLGYSHRKIGKLNQAIGFYRQALTINPNYLLAREYLGEGYVAAGRVDLAQLQLGEIGRRCGGACREYTMLAKVISTQTATNW